MTAWYDSSNEALAYDKACGHIRLRWDGGDLVEITKSNNRSVVITVDDFEDLGHLSRQLAQKMYEHEENLAALPETE